MTDATTAITGATQTFTLADLERLEQTIRSMPKPPWTLIAPDGRAWQDTDPQVLFRVLAGAVMANWPAGVHACEASSIEDVVKMVYRLRTAVRTDSGAGASREAFEVARKAEGDLIDAIRALGVATPVEPSRVQRLRDAIEGECDGLAISEQHARAILQFVDGVGPSVPVGRPATMEEAQRAAQIGACLPNGVLFDAYGNPRVRHIRVIFDGSTCVVSTDAEAEQYRLNDPEGTYEFKDVYLSKEEFDAMPEFDGF